MNTHLIRLIHVGCRELGIDVETRHDLQMRLTGKASLKDMTAPELNLVVNELKANGFVMRESKNLRRKRAPRADIRFCHVMWRLLHEAGAVREPGEKGLNAFVRKRFEKTWGYVPVDVDALQEWSEIKDVVEALKDWCDRAGVELDR